MSRLQSEALRLDQILDRTLPPATCKRCGRTLTPTALINHLGLFPRLIPEALCPRIDLDEMLRLRYALERASRGNNGGR